MDSRLEISGNTTSPQFFKIFTLHTQLMLHTMKKHTNQTSPDLFFLINMYFSVLNFPFDMNILIY